MNREQARKWFQSHMTSDLMVNKAHDMAIEALSAESEWIPCSERLPEFPFISCDAHGNIHIPQGIFTFEDSRGIWCIDDVYDDKRTLHYGNRIIAWMPLPTPYKGGEDE